MNLPSSEQVQYATTRIHQIATEKRNELFSDAPANSLSHETVVALQEAGRRPTMLPRHLVLRNIAAAVSRGAGVVSLDQLVRVPHRITLAHRRWADGTADRETLVAQIQARCQQLVDGLQLGTITPADAIAQMEAFQVSTVEAEKPAKAPKAKKEKAVEVAPEEEAEPVKAEKKRVRKPAPKKPAKELL